MTDFYDDPGDYSALLAALERDGELASVPQLLRRADGDRLWVSASARTVSHNGVPALLMAVVDIAVERAARDEGLEARRHLDAILKNASACVFLKDLDGRFILVNRTVRALLETAGPADPVGHTSAVYYSPADAQRLTDQDAHVVRTRSIFRQDETLATRDGEERVMRITKFPVLDENGDVVAVGGISLDVTAEHKARESEQHMQRLLQSIIDNAPVHISLKDTDGRYILVNRSLRERFIAATGLSNPIGEKSLSHFRPEDAAKFARLDREVVRTGSAVSDEIEINDWSGRNATFRITKFPVFGGNGEVMAIGGIGADVTEQRELEQQLRQVQKMEAVGQLTGGIAHDFNNLLAVILGNAELLIEDLAGDPDRCRMATLVQTAAERAAELTRRLLAFSRQQDLEPTVVACGQLIDDLAGLLRRTLGEHIEVEFTMAPDLWPVRVDRGGLENCLVNLAVNARDAMATGGLIHISGRNLTVTEDMPAPISEMPAGGFVYLSVADNGCGMPPEVVGRAFDPFFTTKEVGKGTGLGLSMVYGFVKQSNGYVAIRSEDGSGTTVDMYLPRSGPDGAAEQKSGPLPTGTETVLVVEDEPFLRAHVAGELRRLGYDVIEAGNGHDALQALHAHEGIALLFTDLIMPGGMRGDELARKARETIPELKVVFTTGYAGGIGETAPGRDARIALLKKPYPRRQLAESIRRCLDEAC
jgi:PAS domain S-box-containing protein